MRIARRSSLAMSLALFKARPGGHLHLQPQRALVQIRQEIAADGGPEADHREQREDHDAIDDLRLLETGGEHPVVPHGQPLQPAVVIHAARACVANVSGGKDHIETSWGRGYTIREHDVIGATIPA